MPPRERSGVRLELPEGGWGGRTLPRDVMQGGRDEFTSMGFVAPSALSGRANGRGGREWLASQVCRGRIAWTRRCTRPSRSLPKWRLQGETHPEAPGHWQEMMRRSSAASSAPVSFRTADSEPAVDVGGGGDDRGRGAGGRQRRGWAWRWWPAREGDEGDGGRAESTVTARAGCGMTGRWRAMPGFTASLISSR
eukprot:ctg_1625.g370